MFGKCIYLTNKDLAYFIQDELYCRFLVNEFIPDPDPVLQ